MLVLWWSGRESDECAEGQQQLEFLGGERGEAGAAGCCAFAAATHPESEQDKTGPDTPACLPAARPPVVAHLCAAPLGGLSCSFFTFFFPLSAVAASPQPRAFHGVCASHTAGHSQCVTMSSPEHRSPCPLPLRNLSSPVNWFALLLSCACPGSQQSHLPLRAPRYTGFACVLFRPVSQSGSQSVVRQPHSRSLPAVEPRCSSPWGPLTAKRRRVSAAATRWPTRLCLLACRHSLPLAR